MLKQIRERLTHGLVESKIDGKQPNQSYDQCGYNDVPCFQGVFFDRGAFIQDGMDANFSRWPDGPGGRA